MDFDSIGDRLKDIQMCKNGNTENDKESMEEVPKILSYEIRDVFHIFASMLDVKSFLKLALTSKKMYNRCMEDKNIRISVNLDELIVGNMGGPFDFAFPSEIVSRRYQDSYVAAMRRLPCEHNIRTLEIQKYFKPEVSMMPEVLTFLKEIRAKNIQKLNISEETIELEALLVIIKEFDVKAVSIAYRIETNTLRSILQLNLEKLSCGPVSLDFILDVDSKIPVMDCLEVENVSKEQLMNICSKVQSGSLRRLIFYQYAVRWYNFDMLPFDHEGPLPDDRPLLLARTPKFDGRNILEYWFLHWHGGITKCKHPMVSCSAKHFRTFASSFTMIEFSHEGPLPDYRPLYCKVSETQFCMLDEDDNLMKCNWDDNCATWEPFNPEIQAHKNFLIEHPTLRKHMFWKLVKQVQVREQFRFYCNGIDDFARFFEDFEKADFDYLGDLPSMRPLVFERSKRKGCPRVVLFEDRLVFCDFSEYSTYSIIQLCHYSNRPPTLFTAGNVLELLKYPDHQNHHYKMRLEVFRDGLELFKKSVIMLEKRLLIFEATTTEFWYRMDESVRKVLWKKGRLSISEGHVRGAPPVFLKEAFKYFAENNLRSLTMELEQFHNCLEQFSTVAFDYSGALTSDSPLAFVKREIRHSCRKGARCQCSTVCSVLVWILWDGMRVTECSWGKYEPKRVVFARATGHGSTPPAFQSKEFLRTLLQAQYDKSSYYDWFGPSQLFHDCLKDFVKLPFNYDGSLPEERPIVFEPFRSNESHFNDDSFYFLLRKDGTLIQCVLGKLCLSLYLPTPYRENNVPPSLSNML